MKRKEEEEEAADHDGEEEEKESEVDNAMEEYEDPLKKKHAKKDNREAEDECEEVNGTTRCTGYCSRQPMVRKSR